jgi:sugar phosphate isomerase/epimerase
VRALADEYGLGIAGNHFGPRAIVQNTWYDPAERAKIFEEAHALGLKQVGTGHSYTAPRSVDGYKAMAEAFNEWGQDAVAHGFRYFYFHNHDAGNDETVDATSPRPRNPAGSANTAWTSRKYLANLEVPKRRSS